MQIIVKKNTRYPSVHIIEGGTTLDLGLLDERERDEMAKEFVEALWAMGPVGSDDCAAWLARMLAEVGIDMPNEGLEPRGNRVGSEPLLGIGGKEGEQ